MKKRLLLSLVALLTASGMWAADGDVFTANTIEGVEMTFMVISETEKTCQVGIGDGDNCSINSAIEGSLTIPSEANGYCVTSIGYYALGGCSGLTAITIPNSIKSIGEYAFYECSGLTSLNIPNSVTDISWAPFFGCSGLISITVENGNSVYDSRENCNAIIQTADDRLVAGCKNTIIPYDVTVIGYSAFGGCSGLTSVTIPNSVTAIGEGAFSNCIGLTSVTVPNSVTTIGNSAFIGCSGLTAITLPNSVTTIGDYAFDGCSSLTSMNIPNNVTSIGFGAFWGCSSLTSVSIPNSVTSIGDYAFFECSSLTSVIIPNSVTSIGNHLFRDCSALTSVTIPNNVTTIGNRAFNGCSSLVSVTLPNNVTVIGTEAFRDCNSLISITIPKSVTSIGEYAFAYCNGLTSIIVENGNGQYDSRNNCNAIIETSTNTLLSGCKKTVIPNSVKIIGNYAFGGCSGLTSISIPNSVTTIGDNAFRNCYGLISVVIPNSVATIGFGAFMYCRELVSVTIPSSVTAIGNSAFRSCNSLERVCSMIESPFVVNAFLYIGTTTLYVPVGTKSLYQSMQGWNQFTRIKELEDVSISLSKNIVTFASEMPLDFSTPISGLKAYTVSDIVDGKAYLREVTEKVDAGMGLILKGMAGWTYTIPHATGSVSSIDNKLVGVTVDTAIGGNDLDYILSNGKFVKASAGTLAAGKAYLRLDAALARGTIDIVGDVTGIDALQNNKEESIKNDDVYNLNGQRISKPAKGLYVVDGKKVMVK